MQEYITEFSKYVITIGMAFYTFFSFFAFRYQEEQGRRWIAFVQNLLMFLLQLVCFVNLVVASRELRYVWIYALVQIFLFSIITLVPLLYPLVNKLLLNNMCMLLGIGLCVVARLSINKAQKQLAIALGAFIISLFIPWLFTKVRFFKKLTLMYGLVGISLLSFVLILGEITNGSKISFSLSALLFFLPSDNSFVSALSDITFQPSEFVKILFIFFLAGALWEDTSLKRVALTTVCAGIHVVVLVVSKDLGSALIFFIGFVLVVFVATRNYWYLLAGAVGGSAAAVLAYHLFDHVRVRVLAWQDPWSYIDNQGYQITQSLFAIGSGSWFGMGLLQGNPKAIPYVDADFIFSSICEELGVITGICLILLCISSFIAMMEISLQIHDRFYQLIVYGIGCMYLFQIFLTIGGGIKFIPLTGVTLPFVSYGGSSIMTTMFMFFIIQGIYIRLQQEGEKHSVRKVQTTKDQTTKHTDKTVHTPKAH